MIGLSSRRRPIASSAERAFETLIGFLFSAYLGLAFGVSILATMAKFQATHSTMPQLVEIGSITFHWLHSVELIFIAFLLALTIFAGIRKWRVAVAVALAAIWTAQGYWLLPILDSRVANLMNGHESAPSSAHIVYAAIEGMKLVILLAAGIVSIAQSATRNP